MNFVLRIDRIVAVVECLLAVGLFLTLMGVLTVNILMRNLVGASLPGTFEIAAGLVLWLALVGGSLALRDQRHIKIEFLLRLVPEAWHRMAEAAAALFGFLVMGVLLVAAVAFTHNEIAIFGESGWLTVIFPLFFMLATFRFALQLYGALSKQYAYQPEWPGLFAPKKPPAP